MRRRKGGSKTSHVLRGPGHADVCPESNIKADTLQVKGSIKPHSKGMVEVDVKMSMNFKEKS